MCVDLLIRDKGRVGRVGFFVYNVLEFWFKDKREG